jgi:hypothetical protein
MAFDLPRDVGEGLLELRDTLAERLRESDLLEAAACLGLVTASQLPSDARGTQE